MSNLKKEGLSRDVIIAEQKSLESSDKMDLNPLAMGASIGASNPIGIPDIFRKRIGTDLSVTSDYCSYDGNNLEFEGMNHDQNLDGCPMSGNLTDLKDKRFERIGRLADTSHS